MLWVIVLWVLFPSVTVRKLIVPQKEPSPLLERKIEELEAKFALMGEDELDELGDEDGEAGDTPSTSQMQTPLTSDMDLMPFTPPQVRIQGTFA